MKLLNRLRALFGKDELDQELSDELSFHLEKQLEKNIAGVMEKVCLFEDLAAPAPVAATPAQAPTPIPVYEEKLELEILPPRDQNEIESIHAYLKTMREVQEVELLTLVDKSLFKVTLNHPVDFMEKLGQLPQVHNAEEVRENGKKKIKIALSAKSKLERNHNEVNDKVNKIFNRKK